MSTERSKRPLAKIMTVAAFHGRFGTQEACAEHLRKVRWGEKLERFVCPDCGHAKGWWLAKRQLVECTECHRQTSVTAGTVFHRVRSPLWMWFWAMYQLSQDKKGVGAIELAKQVGVCYATAWLMLHKLRAAMRRRDDARSLKKFAEKRIEKGSTLKTDGWSAYGPVAAAGYGHHAIVAGSGKEAVEKFPWVHTFISNLKRMLLGTYHSVSAKHLDRYLAEFSYRANRRWMEDRLFDRLLVASVSAKPLTRKQLVTGDR